MPDKQATNRRLLDIFTLYRGNTRKLNIDDMSDSLGIPKSTIYRYVRTLSERGFIEKVGNGYYTLGLAFVELSRNAFEVNLDLFQAVLPSMKRLFEQTQESVSLMRLFQKQAICIESIEGAHALRVAIQRGRVQPLHAGASSKILLAAQPEDTWNDYLTFPLSGFTDTTIVNKAALFEELRNIQEVGYSISDGEIDKGARALAVAVKNNSGEVVAALSIEAPSIRMSEELIPIYLEWLEKEIDQIQETLI